MLTDFDPVKSATLGVSYTYKEIMRYQDFEHGIPLMAFAVEVIFKKSTREWKSCPDGV